MRIDVITLFPDFFQSVQSHSIVGRAIASGKVELVTHNLRDSSTDNYGSVDDRPYGGGVGMVLRYDVLLTALNSVKSQLNSSKVKTILMTPQGQVYKQQTALELSKETNLILICGHYEGFDERIRQHVDMEISIGDYVLTGGEIPALVVIDSVTRLIPGVLGHDESSHDESHTPTNDTEQSLLEYPQYTRPEEHMGQKVPKILLSGNHPKIEEWRKQQAILRTKKRRPDLIDK